MSESIVGSLLIPLQKLMDEKIPGLKIQRNYGRQFSDGVLLAQIIYHSCKKLVEIHNYSPAGSIELKKLNWETLNRKVMSKLRIFLHKKQIEEVVRGKPGTIDKILVEVGKKLGWDLRLDTKSNVSETSNSQCASSTKNLFGRPNAGISVPKQNYKPLFDPGYAPVSSKLHIRKTHTRERDKKPAWSNACSRKDLKVFPRFEFEPNPKSNLQEQKASAPIHKSYKKSDESKDSKSESISPSPPSNPGDEDANTNTVEEQTKLFQHFEINVQNIMNKVEDYVEHVKKIEKKRAEEMKAKGDKLVKVYKQKNYDSKAKIENAARQSATDQYLRVYEVSQTPKPRRSFRHDLMECIIA